MAVKDLQLICCMCNLPKSGSKLQIMMRVVHYLKTLAITKTVEVNINEDSVAEYS